MCQDMSDTEREGRFMDKGRFVIETHLRTGRSIGELARVYDMDRSWLYRRLARAHAVTWASTMSRDRVAYVSRHHNCARGGIRTRTPSRTMDFESTASAIPPPGPVGAPAYPQART